MGRKGSKKVWPQLGDAFEGLTSRTLEHFGYLQTHLTEGSQRGRFISLRLFLEWCRDEGVTHPHELSLAVLQRYRDAVLQRQTRTGRLASQAHRLQLWHAVRMFCHWLTRHGYLTHNPVPSLERMPAPKREPQPVLSALEAEVVLAQPDLELLDGLRDRAILEVMYSTGLRRTEVARLELADINATAGTLLVREGKGKRDRVVPIGARALAWLQRYLDEARREWVKLRPNEKHIFLGERCLPLKPNTLSAMVRRYLSAAGVTKPGACHLLRRTMATEMLANGADVRVIQQILGHANLDTTALYTRVSFPALQAACATAHPGKALSGSPLSDGKSLEYLYSLAALAAKAAKKRDRARGPSTTAATTDAGEARGAGTIQEEEEEAKDTAEQSPSTAATPEQPETKR
jgi:integrase/recombinase XerD